MERLLFGISGLPLGDGSVKYNYPSGIAYLKSIGLDAMELPFVRNVNVTDKNKDAILREKNEQDLYLSAHGSYFINLNAEEPEKQEQSLERIIKGARALHSVGGRSLVFHPGFYLNDSAEDTYGTIKENLFKLPDLGVHYRLETTGKPTQFGSLDELIALCREVPTCRLCVDFAHLHARGGGALKAYEDFTAILTKIRDGLGEAALQDMHIHLSGIHYGAKGEKNHLEFKESDFPYQLCLQALKDLDVKGCIICESPILERDALLLKETYAQL
ncbi:deoxyribonuclease-4 [Hydrogenispora ethanolica]|jgi:deoxyribonuclease-4|uniref:Deoxyribonuclease-4 n=1 Tax=Hydrogenispora ethanolica TaxID=1082276 RepID=A0A4R1RCN7_HYDET|nr:TIM barrel protein [Hydrogenispora ethanolica]TCL63360.1 deoxyribonuclease-4 [Hydrogenispora ethanolica]